MIVGLLSKSLCLRYVRKGETIFANRIKQDHDDAVKLLLERGRTFNEDIQRFRKPIISKPIVRAPRSEAIASMRAVNAFTVARQPVTKRVSHTTREWDGG